MGEGYIGVDFGGSNIRFVIYEREKDIFSNFVKKPLYYYSELEEEVRNNLIFPINEIIQEQKKKGIEIKGIGFSLAARFDRNTGEIVEWSNNQKYKGFPIQKYLTKVFHIPISMIDDGNAAALGEQWKGKGADSFAYITVGTGVGCGLIIQNQLLLGNHGWAGELGHIQVTNDNDRICTCGSIGCLQAVSSGRAIVNRYKKLISGSSDTDIKINEAKTIMELADSGDRIAIDVVKEAGEYLGKTIANMAVLFDISLFILGGGVISQGNIFFQYIKQSVDDHLQGKRDVEMRITDLNDKNGMMGAIKWMI